MATLVCFLEGQVLMKSDENHCFFRGKFQSQVSIARVVLVLFEGHVHTRVEKTHWFYRGNANRERRTQRVPLLPSVWHVWNLVPVRKFQSQRKRRCFKRFLIFLGEGCVADVRQTSLRTACCLSVILLQPFGFMRVSRVNGAIFIQASVRPPFKPVPLAFRIVFHGVQHAIHRGSAALRQ